MTKLALCVLLLAVVPAAALAEEGAPSLAFFTYKYGPTHVQTVGVLDLSTEAPTVKTVFSGFGADAENSREAMVFSPDGLRVAIVLATKQFGPLVNKDVARRLVVGDLATGAATWTKGDPSCKGLQCFEVAARFSADGTKVFTKLLFRYNTLVDVYDAKLKRRAHFDETKGVFKKGLGLEDPLLNDDGSLVLFTLSTLGENGATRFLLRAIGKKGKPREVYVQDTVRVDRVVWHDGRRVLSMVFAPSVGDAVNDTIAELVLDELDDAGGRARKKLFSFKVDEAGKNRNTEQTAVVRGDTAFFLDAATAYPPEQELVAVALAGGEPERLLTGCGPVVAVSPDGKRVACGAYMASGAKGPVTLKWTERGSGVVHSAAIPGVDDSELRALAFVQK